MDLLSLYKKHKKQFDRYEELLLFWNQKINLTSITQSAEVAELHFLDSMVLAPHIVSRDGSVPRETSFLDLGAGAGFPGLPLKIIFPKIQMVLVDSVKKKCDFMKTVVRELDLKEVFVRHHFLKKSESIGKYDFVISRAAFKLKELFELALPNLKQGGKILALKGEGIEEEIREMETSHELSPLGCKIEIKPYELPTSKKNRNIVIGNLKSV